MGPMTPFLEQAIGEMLTSTRTGDRCTECGFSWGLPPAESLSRIRAAPERFGALLEGRDATAAPEGGGWSPSAYTWHVADLVRAWAERLHAFSIDPSLPWAGFDPDELAAARSYSELPQVTGPWALARSTEAFVHVLSAVDVDAAFDHPEWGRGTIADALRWLAHEVVHHELDIRRGLRLPDPTAGDGA
jgi:hypothetical protein